MESQNNYTRRALSQTDALFRIVFSNKRRKNIEPINTATGHHPATHCTRKTRHLLFLLPLTREHSQVIPSVCLHILPTCKGYYSKKKPKRIWALIASFKSYEVFRFLYSKVHNTKIFISHEGTFPSHPLRLPPYFAHM